jgi:hypothetical protein
MAKPRWFPRDALAEVMPHEVWETLSDHGKRVCRFVKTKPGVRPKGAGVMHPLASERVAAVSAE